jgi:hypothetical protein
MRIASDNSELCRIQSSFEKRVNIRSCGLSGVYEAFKHYARYRCNVVGLVLLRTKFVYK